MNYTCALYGLQLSAIMQAEYTGPYSLVCSLAIGYVSGVISNVHVWSGPDVEYHLETEINYISGMYMYVQLICDYIATYLHM